MNYRDFIHVTCILYGDLVENFKFAVRIYVWLSKLHALTTGRLYHATFLSNSTCLYVSIRCCYTNSKSIELWVLWTHVPACSTDMQCLCDPTYNETQKPHSSRESLKMSLVPQVFLFVPGEWCVVHPQHQTKKGKSLRGLLLVVLYFPNLSKAKELKLHRWSAFMLPGQSVVEKI